MPLHMENLNCVYSNFFHILHVRSHLLQVLDNNQIRIHEAINTVLHAGLLASVQFARRNLAGDTFAETGVGEGVDGCEPLVS